MLLYLVVSDLLLRPRQPNQSSAGTAVVVRVCATCNIENLKPA